MADCLGYLFDIVDQSPSEEEDIDTGKLPVIGNDFIDTRLLNRRNTEGMARIEEGAFREMDTVV
ncbi:hypothetical protein [Cohnella zeiphila]|uniref:Uncharacterized protein n=1 Tax=Cohnella zeiphila TaxID=2761120 RepID=A0A7X0SJY4_9BACL|nr:hypothetical protein [Cohnella zeiphila]